MDAREGEKMTKRHWTDYQVGQRVYAAFYFAKNELLTISSVGRKYVRFGKQDNNVVAEKGSKEISLQGERRIGTLYESEEAYHKFQSAQKLRKTLSFYNDWYSLPDEKIKAIAEILEIES
jgi:hypothetical protein